MFYSFPGQLVCHWATFNSLPKILDWSKYKTFADDEFNMDLKLKIVYGRVENIVGIGENADNQHFLLFPQCFQKSLFFGVFKSLDCVVKS